MNWIVPEPDPYLSLRITDIEISSLRYHDIQFIVSASMKKYFDEFMRLEGFYTHMHHLIRIHTINSRIKELLPSSRYLNNGSI